MKYIYISLLLIYLTLTTACNKPDNNSMQIYAASSLTDVLNQLIDEYNNVSQSAVTISYAGSSTLRKQIEFGATPDIFISADEIQFKKIQESDMLSKSPYKLAENKLAMITNNPNIKTLEDVIKDDISIVVGMNEVPIGSYTNQLLDNINDEGIYHGDYSDLFNTNIVSKERNVKMVMSKVVLKEIDVAVVYETDYTSIDNNEIYKIHIPENVNIKTSIYAGILNQSLKDSLGKDFLNYISSDELKHIWLQYGFIIQDCDC